MQEQELENETELSGKTTTGYEGLNSLWCSVHLFLILISHREPQASQPASGCVSESGDSPMWFPVVYV